MSRTKFAKRKRNAPFETPNKVSKPSNVITPPPDAPIDATIASSEPKSLHTLISDEELELTIDTLRTLAKYPSAIKAKGCKELRVAVYDFRQACSTGVNTGGENFL
jgi:hypothetical protein